MIASAPKLYLPSSVERTHSKYFGAQGEPYDEPNTRGFLSLPILQFLWGQKWDDIALNCVHSLRPSYIRVVLSEETTDSHLWRVTVRLDSTRTIREIKQEVEVALYGGYDHGHALWQEIKGLVDKPRVR